MGGPSIEELDRLYASAPDPRLRVLDRYQCDRAVKHSDWRCGMTAPALSPLHALPGHKGTDTNFTCRCPAHEDRENSLSVSVADDGKVLLKCFADCDNKDILAAMGLHLRDLWPPKTPGQRKRITHTYDYVDAGGRLLYQSVRYTPKDFRQRRPNGRGGWIPDLKGVERVLYRYPEVLKAKAEGRTIYFCEGEKDADRLVSLGLCATTAGGVSAWRDAYEAILQGTDMIVLEDNDKPGREYSAKVASKIIGATILRLPGLSEGGDVSDWLDAGGTLEQFHELVAQAREQPLEEAPVDSLLPVTFASMAAAHPHLNTPVIDGLLRQGETMNLIAAPKTGKSWMVYDLALSITTGGPWLDYFQCTPGRVLIIDNELHAQTLAHRIPKVAEARRVPSGWESRLDVLSLRGAGLTLDTLAPVVRKITAGKYAVIILDAWYRFIPPGHHENDNADVMSLYNMLDQYAALTGAAMIAIHHQSKGAQGEKAVTDVGAGAGAQSRAADTHLVLRQHEEDGCIVLDAAVRSFPPVEPLGLRWDFPLWQPAYNIDTGAIQGRRPRYEVQREEKDRVAIQAILGSMADGPMSVREVRRVLGGAGQERAERILDRLENDGTVMWESVKIHGGTGKVYRLTEPGLEPGLEPGTAA